MLPTNRNIILLRQKKSDIDIITLRGNYPEYQGNGFYFFILRSYNIGL